MPAGLTLAAIPEREDPRDALVGRKLAELPQGARVGTSSLAALGSTARLAPGSGVSRTFAAMSTPVAKLDEGQYDAIVLASAGLRRLAGTIASRNCWIRR